MLETIGKDRLQNDHVWPIGRNKLDVLIGDSMPDLPSSLRFSMPTKGYFNSRFKKNDIRAVAILKFNPEMRRIKSAFNRQARLMPCAITLFAVPRNEAKCAFSLINDKLGFAIGTVLQRNRHCEVWFGADKMWKNIIEDIYYPPRVPLREKAEFSKKSKCPFCEKPLRTDKAKQCPHCFKNWRDSLSN